jgi:hypothetical protein
MQRWSSPRPLRLPIPFSTVARLDLEFVDLRREGGSLTAYVFVDAEPVPPDAGRDHESFVGSFSVFAPYECWGVDDHCDWSKGPVSPFDRRPPHHMTPINISMEVTEALARLGDAEQFTVTVHAARRGDLDADEGVLRFERLTALAYQ